METMMVHISHAQAPATGASVVSNSVSAITGNSRRVRSRAWRACRAATVYMIDGSRPPIASYLDPRVCLSDSIRRHNSGLVPVVPFMMAFATGCQFVMMVRMRMLGVTQSSLDSHHQLAACTLQLSFVARGGATHGHASETGLLAQG